MKMIKQPTIPPMPKRPTFDARDTQYNLPIGTDLISRKQAIEVVQNRHMMLSKEKVLLINDLEKLPPALSTNLAEVGTDCISRQQAIKATWQDTGYTDPFNVMTAIRDRIKQLPPIQPKRGKWIDRGERGDWEWQADGRGKHWHEWECNICHHYFAERSFFCPHCGSDMRGVNHESN